jgi:hypothetical protein
LLYYTGQRHFWFYVQKFSLQRYQVHLLVTYCEPQFFCYREAVFQPTQPFYMQYARHPENFLSDDHPENKHKDNFGNGCLLFSFDSG